MNLWMDLALCALVGVAFRSTKDSGLRQTGTFLIGLSVVVAGASAAVLVWGRP